MLFHFAGSRTNISGSGKKFRIRIHNTAYMHGMFQSYTRKANSDFTGVFYLFEDLFLVAGYRYRYSLGCVL